jgi:LacI family transcriptional regulator
MRSYLPSSARPPRVTLQDVADAALVSKTAVSFVLNGRAGANIPADTRERILAAAAQLGYRPNAMARALRQGDSSLVGFVTDEIATTPFAGQIFRGAQDTAWQHRRILTLVNTDHQNALEQEALNTLLQHQVGAFVLASMSHNHVQVPQALAGLPVVLVNASCPRCSAPSVVPDELRAGREATEHLLQFGHRRIGLINNLDVALAAPLRIQGYQQALQNAGLTPDPRWVVHINGWQAAGFAGAMALLQQSDRPTALFCLNDQAAMGAIDAARVLGLRVPEDLSVIGFDDLQLIAAHLRPALTTMRLPHYDMGQWGIQALFSERGEPPEQARLHCPLISRASVGPVPA